MKQEVRALSSRQTELLSETQQWRLVELLFERPREGWWAEVAELGASSSDPELVAAALAASAAREGEYHALFGPGGLVSPREAGHRKTTDPSKLLSEIHAFYDAFKFEPATEETIDHVCVEAGFVGWLKLKEAYARAAGDLAAADLTAETARQFVERHLATMAEPIHDRLNESGSDYLIAAARCLLARTGPRPKNVEGGWVPDGLAGDDCSFVCAARTAGCPPQSGDEDSEFEDPFGPAPRNIERWSAPPT